MHTRERHISRRGSLARIHESQNPVVLDRPAVDRQRLREGAREEQVQLSARATAGEQEGLFDADGSGGESVNLHGVL